MASLKMVRKHGAEDLDGAKVKVRHVLREMKPTLDKYVDRVDWNGDETQARVKGKHVSGTFTVDTENLVVDLKLSWAAGLVKSTIAARIDEALQQHL